MNTPPLGRVALLHPGSMGATIGAALVHTGHTVRWSGEGRSPASHDRARAAGMVDAGSLVDLLHDVDTVLSVCPPDAAVMVARQVSELGGARRYIDANAIAPETAREIAEIVGFGGGTFVDGGIIGPPAHTAGTTRLYLSGDDAELAAGAFEGSLVEAIATDGGAGGASALKLCYAGWTKGSAALLLTMRSAAESAGVADALIAEWERSQPGLVRRSEQTAASAAPKAWRWVGEMEEIAAFLAAAELPNGSFAAAAELFARLEGCKDQVEPPLSLDQVMGQIRR
ncbi:MAG: DUF1932 domain-containing protein [Acidimicrobiales bacterium]